MINQNSEEKKNQEKIGSVNHIYKFMKCVNVRIDFYDGILCAESKFERNDMLYNFLTLKSVVSLHQFDHNTIAITGSKIHFKQYNLRTIQLYLNKMYHMSAIEVHCFSVTYNAIQSFYNRTDKTQLAVVGLVVFAISVDVYFRWPKWSSFYYISNKEYSKIPFFPCLF